MTTADTHTPRTGLELRAALAAIERAWLFSDFSDKTAYNGIKDVAMQAIASVKELERELTAARAELEALRKPAPSATADELERRLDIAKRCEGNAAVCRVAREAITAMRQRDAELAAKTDELAELERTLYDERKAGLCQQVGHQGVKNHEHTFCPHCNPCRKLEALAAAERLNKQYDFVLRGLASWLAAGGYNSDGLIEPQVADKKIRWGVQYLIDHKDAELAAKTAECERYANVIADVVLGMNVLDACRKHALRGEDREVPPQAVKG